MDEKEDRSLHTICVRRPYVECEASFGYFGAQHTSLWTDATKMGCIKNSVPGPYRLGFRKASIPVQRSSIRDTLPAEYSFVRGTTYSSQGRVDHDVVCSHRIPIVNREVFGSKRNACHPGKAKKRIFPMKYWTESRIYSIVLLAWAINSAGECYLDVVEVTSSNLVSPIRQPKRLPFPLSHPIPFP